VGHAALTAELIFSLDCWPVKRAVESALFTEHDAAVHPLLKEGGPKVKTMMIALFAAALIVAAPAVPAQVLPSKTPALQYKVLKKHHLGISSYARLREVQAKGSKKGYPGVFGYAPGSTGLDRDLEASRQAGGGGGGGSGM